MKEVRVGVIGVGIMGSGHAKRFQSGEITGARLAAVCDIDPAQRAKWTGVPTFASADELIASKTVDAVIIATPHYAHTTIGIAALKAGLHVLVEKPISVHKADCERLIAAHRNRKQVFSTMFQMRTEPHYRRLRDLIQAGELGEIQRVIWIITNWFRTEAYYASGGWRATWAGEGGGVLMNQCPHNLDLLQWFVGMPKRIRAFCHLGKYHNIEVEDDVTAYMEFPNGATGVFVTTTGEAPGTNRLEITGTRGKIILQDGRLNFVRNEIPSDVFNRTTKSMFDVPPWWNVEIPIWGQASGHRGILQNFINAILNGEPLIAPAEEGQAAVELANAMLWSSLTSRTIELPFSAAGFERQLKKLIAGSRYKKTVRKDVQVNFESSLNR